MVITFEQWNTCWYVPTIISLDMDYISSNWFAFELCSSNIVSKYLTRFLWTISTGNNRMQNTCPSYYRKLYSSFFIKKNRKLCSNWAGNVPNKKPELVSIIKFSYIGQKIFVWVTLAAHLSCPLSTGSKITKARMNQQVIYIAPPFDL
jgi:hypothetical protein